MKQTYTNIGIGLKRNKDIDFYCFQRRNSTDNVQLPVLNYGKIDKHWSCLHHFCHVHFVVPIGIFAPLKCKVQK